MNLFLQLLPYGLLAAIALGALTLFVLRESQQRRRRRTAAPRTSSTAPVSQMPASSREASPATARAQVLRLNEFGITPAQIATVLGLPQEEVELIVQLARYSPWKTGAAAERAVRAGQVS